MPEQVHVVLQRLPPDRAQQKPTDRQRTPKELQKFRKTAAPDDVASYATSSGRCVTSRIRGVSKIRQIGELDSHLKKFQQPAKKPSARVNRGLLFNDRD